MGSPEFAGLGKRLLQMKQRTAVLQIGSRCRRKKNCGELCETRRTLFLGGPGRKKKIVCVFSMLLRLHYFAIGSHSSESGDSEVLGSVLFFLCSILGPFELFYFIFPLFAEILL